MGCSETITGRKIGRYLIHPPLTVLENQSFGMYTVFPQPINIHLFYCSDGLGQSVLILGNILDCDNQKVWKYYTSKIQYSYNLLHFVTFLKSIPSLKHLYLFPAMCKPLFIFFWQLFRFKKKISDIPNWLKNRPNHGVELERLDLYL